MIENNLEFLIVLIPFLLCWGSFLNVVGYRIIRGQSVVHPRSRCPHCNHQIAWYDNIPLFSWLLLRARCRQCKTTISWLYPFIELLTIIALLPLFYLFPLAQLSGYILFFSALIVTIRSDLETMLISRWVTLFLIPFGILLSSVGLLHITAVESLIGILFGYGVLYVFAKGFTWITGKDGMGEADLELLAFIGAFTGLLGCWFSLMIGSMIGTLCGIIYLYVCKKSRDTRIPFGPFLALGAIVYILFQDSLTGFLGIF